MTKQQWLVTLSVIYWCSGDFNDLFGYSDEELAVLKEFMNVTTDHELLELLNKNASEFDDIKNNLQWVGPEIK